MLRNSEKGEALAAATDRASSEAAPIAKESNVGNSTEIQASSQPDEQAFNFEGRNVRVLMKDGGPWFVAKDLCAVLGLTNSRKALKALADDEKGVSSSYTLGGEQQMAVVSEGGMWTLVLRCRDAVIEGTVPYRVRRWVTGEVLPAIRKTGVYVGKPFVVNPGDVLTQGEQNTLRLMLKMAAEKLPKGKQGALMVQGWSKLKKHFAVPYREIPRQEFSEAVSILARHAAEWEVVDETPKLSVDDAVRLDAAFHIATQAAAQVQREVFKCVMEGERPDALTNQWMLYFHKKSWRDEAPDAYCKPLAMDAICLSPNEYFANLERGDGHQLNDEQLMTMAEVAVNKLAKRARWRTSQANGVHVKQVAPGELAV